MEQSAMIARDQQYIAHTYGRFPLVLTHGKGSLCWDEHGNEYIDLATGIGVTCFGYCDDNWVEAVSRQAAVLQHTSNLYYTQPCIDLAQLLCEKTGMCRVFFSNSGAESNECAIKAARKYAVQTKGPHACTILTLENSFHGRTLTTLAATGQEQFHQDFLPLTPGFRTVKPNDIAALEQAACAPDIAAVMMEIVQGEGGVQCLDAAFVQAAARVCAQHNLLLIVDEVQTGNGRTGALYSYMHYGIQPDIVTTAKGLGGGLPIGATLLGEKVKDVFSPGSHGSTFGGNPVCCAGALSVLRRLNEPLFAQVQEKSAYIFAQLADAPGVKSVSGLGLMIGVEPTGNTDAIVQGCREHGVLVIKAKNKIRLLPALNIPFEQLAQAIAVLKAQCALF